MSIAGFDLERSDGSHAIGPLNEGWTRMGPTNGVHLFREASTAGECYSVRISSGVLDGGAPGGTHFKTIRVDFGRPISTPVRPGVRVEGNVLVIGNTPGGDCIAPRGRIAVRVAIGSDPLAVFNRTRILDSVRYAPGKRVKLPADIAATPSWVAGFRAAVGAGLESWQYGFDRPSFGCYHPWGYWQRDAPGGKQISFAPGWEGSCEVALTRSDLGMERANLDCLRASDGEPHLSPPLPPGGYSLERGWNKSTALPSFSVDVGNDKRAPLWANAGPCDYESLAASASDYGTTPRCPNGQHLRRLTAEPEAAAEQWGDKLAALELRIAAADASYSMPQSEADSLLASAQAKPGAGHGYLGTRECGWVLDAMGAHPGLVARVQTLGRACDLARMQNGCINSIGFPASFSPSPWAAPISLPQNLKVTQAMEQTIMYYALARAGFTDAAMTWHQRCFVAGGPRDPSILDRYGTIPKFLGTEQLGQVLRRCSQGGGGTGFFNWVDIGMALLLAPVDAPYLAVLTRIGTPGEGWATSTADCIAKLKVDINKDQGALAYAALKAIP